MGQIHGLIGPNGAGKTTIFNCITGFYRPTSGIIRFRDRDVTHLRPDQIARLGIARTFQNVQLFRSMSALDNVLVARHSHMRTGVLAEGPRPARSSTGRSAWSATRPRSSWNSSASWT